MDNKLFAVYLGGRAQRCNTELHDVVFVVGPSIEATYEQLMDKWFGDPLRLHIDSWMELRIIDGQRIVLRQTPPAQAMKLFFINLGAYLPGQFTELHANAFVVAETEQQVKLRAKSELLRGTQSLHTDDLFDIDDCLEIAEVDGHHIHLEPADRLTTLRAQLRLPHYSQTCRGGLCGQPQTQCSDGNSGGRQWLLNFMSVAARENSDAESSATRYSALPSVLSNLTHAAARLLTPSFLKIRSRCF